ncbi:MAG TPA: hypothetical protein VNJ12_10795 [Candidatus Dormibacteraeota bacterium]|nr:hypothetical protein [Candidatus Dormibacteraeota bacterium]
MNLAVGRRQFYRQTTAAASAKPAPAAGPPSAIGSILDLGRWAPSGGNVQPWRLRILDDTTVAIDLRRDPTGQIYEYRGGEPTLLAVGMLLETLRVAATAWQRAMTWDDPILPSVVIRFPPAPDMAPDPLLSFLTLRSVHRRATTRRRLTPGEKQALEACLGDGLTLDWHEGGRMLWRFGQLNAAATGIRLRAPEAFPIHQRVLDWSHVHSPDRIPVGAIGLARPMLPPLRWAMQRWGRMRGLNRLGGAAVTAAQLDQWPAWNSAAFFVIRDQAAAGEAAEPARLLRTGQSLQRFWLTATRLGLALQPTLATLAFAHYGASGEVFSQEPSLPRKAAGLARRFKEVTGHAPGEVVFLGRIGAPKLGLPGPRSIRLALDHLIEEASGGPAPGV